MVRYYTAFFFFFLPFIRHEISVRYFSPSKVQYEFFSYLFRSHSGLVQKTRKRGVGGISRGQKRAVSCQMLLVFLYFKVWMKHVIKFVYIIIMKEIKIFFWGGAINSKGYSSTFTAIHSKVQWLAETLVDFLITQTSTHWTCILYGVYKGRAKYHKGMLKYDTFESNL